MTTRFRIQLASLAVASTCVFALADKASAFDLLEQLVGKGGTSYGCSAPECYSGSSKGGGKSTCGCCAHTPILDRVTDWTRSVKCKVASIELPRLQMPCIDLSNLFRCNRCCECAGGKSDMGKTMSDGHSLASPPPVDSAVPVHAPPVPIIGT